MLSKREKGKWQANEAQTSHKRGIDTTNKQEGPKDQQTQTQKGNPNMNKAKT